MECFYHPERTAVGTCRACTKGVCRECAVDLDRGLACRDRCETAARDVIFSIDQSIRVQKASGNVLRSTRGLWILLGVVAVLLGVGVAFWGFTLPVFREISLLGIPFLILGLVLIRMAGAARAAQPPPVPDRSP